MIERVPGNGAVEVEQLVGEGNRHIVWSLLTIWTVDLRQDIFRDQVFFERIGEEREAGQTVGHVVGGHVIAVVMIPHSGRRFGPVFGAIRIAGHAVGVIIIAGFAVKGVKTWMAIGVRWAVGPVVVQGRLDIEWVMDSDDHGFTQAGANRWAGEDTVVGETGRIDTGDVLVEALPIGHFIGAERHAVPIGVVGWVGGIKFWGDAVEYFQGAEAGFG